MVRARDFGVDLDDLDDGGKEGVKMDVDLHPGAMLLATMP